MKISIKTLKGELFQVEIDESSKVADLKTKIEESREDHGAARQKLIHAGKVLKDEQVISEIGIAEADFIVCMITKEVAKKPVAAPAPAAPVAAPAPAQVAPSATAAADPRPAAAAPSTPLASSGAQFVTAEGLAALMGMGFPESESRAALSAAMGNPDLAYEFLLTGIPPAAAQRVSSSPAAAPAGAVTIDALRRHPQFNMLKQLVQTNPGALSQVLDLIGQQSPELLAAIHANNDAFIAMMNEPIVDTPPPAPAPVAQAPAGGMGGGNPLSNPAVMMQMLAAMPAAQRAQFAQQLGMDPQQLEGMMQMMASMPPEQMEAILNQGMGGGGHNHGADPPGVIRLTEEEMAAVNRLVALGFSQQQAAQAYLACDKNETLAANLLFEGGWGDDEGGMGGFDGGDEDDNMYN